MKPSSKSSNKPKLEPARQYSFVAIGTRWWIGIYQPMSVPAWHRLQRIIAARIEQFDQTYSRFRSDSLVTAIAKKVGDYRFPSDAPALFGFYRQLYEATDGLVTPLVGQALSDAGYDATYSLQPKRLHRVPAWDDVMHFEHGTLQTSQPVLLDVGAAGKGYLVDIIAQLVEAAGVQAYCIDASGDLVFRHPTRTLRVGLEHPDDSQQVIGVVDLRNQALCGSATNRRQWAGLHHVLNPRTLQPTSTVKAAWAIAPSALLADGLATALFFVPPRQLHKHFEFTYVVVGADNVVVSSPNLPGRLFVANS